MPRIWIPGHRGLAGSALLRACRRRGFDDLLLRGHAELDLTRQAEVEAFVAAGRPDWVLLAAAQVGGIEANRTRRYDFIQRNLAIELNVIEACRRAGTPRLLFLGSSCIYPRDCPQPMREEHLLTGPLEPSNEPYAVAKIAGLKLVESCNRQHGSDWISAMPTNLYGPGDNYDLEGGHVLAALLRRFHEAKLAGHQPVAVWGSGRPLREFLHADDLAEACLFMLAHCHAGQAPNDTWNVGSGAELSIRELAEAIQRVVGHRGEIAWDASRPDGTPRKLLDCGRLAALGWRAAISLEQGLHDAYRAFQADAPVPPSSPPVPQVP